MKKQRFLNILKYLKLSLLVPFIFLLLVHFVIKDRSIFFAKIFNIFPVPFLIIIGLVLSLILYKYKKVFKAVIVITMLLICHWAYSYYGFKNIPVSSENNHVLFWNIDNTKFLPREEIKENIRVYNPDILVFLETRKLGLTEVKYLKEQFPQYEFKTLQGYCLIAISGHIESTTFKRFGTKTKSNLVKAKINGQPKTILISDILVDKGYQNRWQDLSPILDYSLKHKVDIIIGDFNTPYESIHFNGFRENYTSFHNVSEGFAATWPKGLPLLELDQIWVTPEIEPISLKKFFYKEFSNHDMLIGSFKFTD